MKLLPRLLFTYLIISVVVVLFGFFSYQNNQRTQQEYQLLNQHSLPLLASLNKLQLGALRIVASTSEAGLLHYLMIDADAGAGEEEEELAEQGGALLSRAIAQYTALVALDYPDDRQFSVTVNASAHSLMRLSEGFFEALESGQSSATLFELKENFELAERQFLVVTQAAIDHETQKIETRTLEVSAALEQHLKILAIGVILMLLLGINMVRSNMVNIVIPLRRFRDAANDIAEGDLSVQVPLRTKDELGALALAFNRMTQGLKHNQQALQEASAYTENILQVMEDILIATDAEGLIKKVNRAACEQLGYAEAQLLNTPVAALLEHNGKTLADFIPINGEGHFERDLRNSQGQRIPVLASLNQIDSRTDRGLLLIASNISARKLAEEKLHKLAFYDPLSGLPNRTLFNDRLQQGIKFALRQKHHMAVLFLDLDNFKQINDSLGHDIGDELLREVSTRLVQTLRDSDVISPQGQGLLTPTVSRHGGDEFLILLPYVADPIDAGKAAERIQRHLSQEFLVKTHEIFTTLSIGISIYPDNGTDARLLVQNADTALYSAKAQGKNQFSFFTAEMNSSALRRLDIENNLRRALVNQEFRLFYQPQLELATGRVIGMEALIRWQHPEWGLVSPMEFIPIAESTGMILAIGDWVLYEACSQWRRWKEQGLDPGKMSVNLSALQFSDNDLTGKLSRIIAESGIDPEALVLEITETVLMQDAEVTLSQLREIKATGVRFAVDDFGTGYSSLSYLKTFPLDYLKIDRAFVRDLESSESDLEIVRTIIAMATRLKLRIIAEGVETPTQLRMLQAQDCTYMQGFLLSRPVPAAAYEARFLHPEHPSDEHTLCRNALGSPRRVGREPLTS